MVDLVKELKDFSLNVHIEDMHANPEDVLQLYGIPLRSKIAKDYDAIIVAVGHQAYKKSDYNYFKSISKDEVVLFDVKGLYHRKKMESARYWRL